MLIRNFKRALSHLVFIVGALLTGNAWAGDVHVKNAWSRPAPPGINVGVAYFAITNDGKNDRLIGVSSPVAERAELHMSMTEGAVMKMKHLDVVEVKHGQPVLFSPNGRHVMLSGLKQPLKSGNEFPLTLNFENVGSVMVQVRVDELATKGEGGHKMDHPQMDHSKMKH